MTRPCSEEGALSGRRTRFETGRTTRRGLRTLLGFRIAGKEESDWCRAKQLRFVHSGRGRNVCNPPRIDG